MDAVLCNLPLPVHHPPQSWAGRGCPMRPGVDGAPAAVSKAGAVDAAAVSVGVPPSQAPRPLHARHRQQGRLGVTLTGAVTGSQAAGSRQHVTHGPGLRLLSQIEVTLLERGTTGSKLSRTSDQRGPENILCPRGVLGRGPQRVLLLGAPGRHAMACLDKTVTRVASGPPGSCLWQR